MVMMIDELQALLAELRGRHGDSTLVEVKGSEHRLPRDLGKTVCAFANMPAGGVIILGVDETQDFAVVGVNEYCVHWRSSAALFRHHGIPSIPFSATRSASESTAQSREESG